MSSPVVSLVIPIYNVERYLRRCLESVLAQTFTDFEAICVDDGSTDSSGAILDEYAAADKRIQAVHKANGGVVSARNAALNLARGEYIGFVDSDDWIERDMISSLVAKAREAGSDVTVCDYYREWGERTFSDREDAGDTGDECIKRLLKGTLHGYLWTKLLRRAAFEGTGAIHSPPYSIMEDVVMSLNIFAFAKSVAKIDKLLYHYFYDSSSAVNTFNTKKAEDMVAVVKRAEELVNSRPDLAGGLLSFKARAKSYIVMQLKGKELEPYKRIWPETNAVILRERSVPVYNRVGTWLIAHNAMPLVWLLKAALKAARTLRAKRYKMS